MKLRSHPNVMKVIWGQSLVNGGWRDVLHVHVNLVLDPEDSRYHAEKVNELRQALQGICASYPDLDEVRILED